VSGADHRRVVVVDDSALQCELWRGLLRSRYGGRAAIETYQDPCKAIEHLGPNVHLMLLDWEMPCMDGREVLAQAQARGVDLKRVIITSAHSAGELHEVFERDDCLAVIEKSEPEQQAAFLMILDSIMKR
jgi:CheY-like chemotaxis protein